MCHFCRRYYYPDNRALSAAAARFDEYDAKLAEKRAQLGEVTAALAEAKAERDAAFADARSDYLKALEMTCQIRIWSLNN